MTQDEQKHAVAREAIKYVVDDAYVGVGTGSTANFFIDELATIKHASRARWRARSRPPSACKGHGIDVVELNNVDDLPVYIDGADEVTEHGAMIKGGGGALTREKIVAAVADEVRLHRRSTRSWSACSASFRCRSRSSRWRAATSRANSCKLGGQPAAARGLHHRQRQRDPRRRGPDASSNPVELEAKINNIVGVVTNGLFARRGADVILLGSDAGVRTLDAHKF